MFNETVVFDALIQGMSAEEIGRALNVRAELIIDFAIMQDLEITRLDGQTFVNRATRGMAYPKFGHKETNKYRGLKRDSVDTIRLKFLEIVYNNIFKKNIKSNDSKMRDMYYRFAGLSHRKVDDASFLDAVNDVYSSFMHDDANIILYNDNNNRRAPLPVISSSRRLSIAQDKKQGMFIRTKDADIKMKFDIDIFNYIYYSAYIDSKIKKSAIDFAKENREILNEDFIYQNYDSNEIDDVHNEMFGSLIVLNSHTLFIEYMCKCMQESKDEAKKSRNYLEVINRAVQTGIIGYQPLAITTNDMERMFKAVHAAGYNKNSREDIATLTEARLNSEEFQKKKAEIVADIHDYVIKNLPNKEKKKKVVKKESILERYADTAMATGGGGRAAFGGTVFDVGLLPPLVWTTPNTVEDAVIF